MDSDKPKLVISGSTRHQGKIAEWKAHFEEKGYEIIAIPDAWDETKEFKQQLTDLYVDFYNAIDACDVFFLLNEDRDDTNGYIGANGTAELIYATVLKLRRKKPLTIYLASMPDETVPAYNEVTSFIKNDWISIYPKV